MKKLILVLGLLGLSSTAFATLNYKCFSTDDNEPYALEQLELTVNSETELALHMDLFKDVTEIYKLNKNYQSKAPGMKGYLKFYVTNPDYDAYGESALTPFFVESALLQGGYPLRRGGQGGFIKTAGRSYSWARYLCILQ